MSWPRLILGGLLAGVVLNAGEVVAVLLLRERYQEAMRALGRQEAANQFSLMAALVITLGVGIFSVWLYAAIRPRYGPGPRTAVIAAVATWLIQGSSNLRYASQGLFPPNLVAMAAVIALVNYTLATLAGAWVYREPSAT
jgi:hypothetical protein